MKRPKQPKLPNYVRKIEYLKNVGVLPSTVGVHMVTVYHDDRCAVFQAQRCNCDPEITLKATMPGTMN